MIRRYLRELTVALVLLLLLLVLRLAPLVRPAGVRSFYDGDQVRNLLVSSAPVLVAAVGMTLVILSRHIDISIGAQFSICAVVAGLAAQVGLPMPLVALTALLMGAGMGAVNGALVVGLELPSIVVTLATLVIGRETLRWWREGEFVGNLPAGFQWFGSGQERGQWLVVGVAGLIFLLFALVLHYLAVGRAVYATGSDEEAARLAGIRPRRVVFGVFVVMGALTGLAALLNAVRFVDVDPNAGTGLELQVIAAVVVGGTAISGGRGTLLGSLVGVALLSLIGPALVFLGTRPEWEKAVQGVILLLASSDALARRKG
jgi:rhamnose transport system permease protein